MYYCSIVEPLTPIRSCGRYGNGFFRDPAISHTAHGQATPIKLISVPRLKENTAARQNTSCMRTCYTYIYISLSLSLYIYICIHMYLSLSLYIYIYIYMYIYRERYHMCTCARACKQAGEQIGMTNYVSVRLWIYWYACVRA